MMESYQVTELMRRHDQLTDELIRALQTKHTAILAYLAMNLVDMSPAEVKICVAMFLEGRADLQPKELAAVTGLHENTIRANTYRPHVLAVKELIIQHKYKKP